MNLKEGDEGASTFKEETRSYSAISCVVYWKYFRSGSGYCSIIIFCLVCIVAQLLSVESDYWLTLWTRAEEARTSSSQPSQFTIKVFWLELSSSYIAIGVFVILVASQFVFIMMRTVHFFIMCMTSSMNLHDKMLESIIRAPLHFFDETPVGK